CRTSLGAALQIRPSRIRPSRPHERVGRRLAISCVLGERASAVWSWRCERKRRADIASPIDGANRRCSRPAFRRCAVEPYERESVLQRTFTEIPVDAPLSTQTTVRRGRRLSDASAFGAAEREALDRETRPLLSEAHVSAPS